MPSPVGYRTDDRIGRKSTPAWAARVPPWLSQVPHESDRRSSDRVRRSGLTAESSEATLGSMRRPVPSPRSRDTRDRHLRDARPGARRRGPDARRGGGPGEPRGPAGGGADAASHRPPHRRPRGGLGDRPVRPPGGRGQRGDRPCGRDAGRQRAARVRRRRTRVRARADPEADRTSRRPPASTASARPGRSRSRWRTTPRRCADDAPGSALVRLGTRAAEPTPLESWARLLFGDAEAAAGD